MHPKLLPIEKKYQDYQDKRNKEGRKSVQEMLKQPYTLEEAIENLTRLKKQRLNIK